MTTLTSSVDETIRIRENLLCALATKIHCEHNLPKRDALLVLADRLLDDMIETKSA